MSTNNSAGKQQVMDRGKGIPGLGGGTETFAIVSTIKIKVESNVIRLYVHPKILLKILS